MFEPLYKYAALPVAYATAGRLVPWFAALTVALLAAGLYGGLVLAPPDYQQGESFRIIYVHVPAAWLSLFAYVVMAAAGATALIWHVKLAEILASASAPLGASFTFVALATGSLWGKPMWGTWWVWDARLTSELVLLFLYLGYMALESAIDDRRAAARACAVLALVGLVNIPIIKYSVEWWHTLHQPATVSKFGRPSMPASMLVPLLLMAVAFMSFHATVLLMRVRTGILERDRSAAWVRALAGAPA